MHFFFLQQYRYYHNNQSFLVYRFLKEIKEKVSFDLNKWASNLSKEEITELFNAIFEEGGEK